MKDSRVDPVADYTHVVKHDQTLVRLGGLRVDILRLLPVMSTMLSFGCKVLLDHV